MSGDAAVDAVLASVESDRSFVKIASLIDDQFEVADHLVIFQYDQDVLHTVVVSQKNFDVTSRSGVIVGVPADRRNGLDDEIGVSAADYGAERVVTTPWTRINKVSA